MNKTRQETAKHPAQKIIANRWTGDASGCSDNLPKSNGSKDVPVASRKTETATGKIIAAKKNHFGTNEGRARIVATRFMAIPHGVARL